MKIWNLFNNSYSFLRLSYNVDQDCKYPNHRCIEHPYLGGWQGVKHKYCYDINFWKYIFRPLNTCLIHTYSEMFSFQNIEIISRDEHLEKLFFTKKQLTKPLVTLNEVTTFIRLLSVYLLCFWKLRLLCFKKLFDILSLVMKLAIFPS